MHSFLFSLPLVVFRSRRAVFYPLIFLKSPIFFYAPESSIHAMIFTLPTHLSHFAIVPRSGLSKAKTRLKRCDYVTE